MPGTGLADTGLSLGLGLVFGGGAAAGNFFLLENGVDEFLLESGTGVLQMEV
jgi:hypothetical protein